MRLLTRSLVAGFAVVGVCAAFLGACGNASEGDRCEYDNGNDDCQDGLVCVQGSQICCPQNRALATTPGCTTSPSPGGEAGIPAEASTFDVAVIQDSATPGDTGVKDSSSDATDANDANDDGG